MSSNDFEVLYLCNDLQPLLIRHVQFFRLALISQETSWASVKPQLITLTLWGNMSKVSCAIQQ